jgi:branched-chain amino acid transport system substrate-binding protein
MLRPRRAWLLLAGVVALLALAADACGGDDKPTPTQTPAATATAATDVTPVDGPTGVSSPEDDWPEVGLPAGKIVLGSHFAASGTYGAAFKPVIEGVKAYFEYVNAEKGGVCGRQIELHAEDDGYEPARAQEVTRKLVEQDHVFAMIGSLGTAAHGAVWEYLNEKGIPDLWVMSSAQKFAADPQANPWTVPAMPSNFVEGAIQGKYISQNLPGKKVAILYQNDEFGRDSLAGLQSTLDPSNELVVPQSYEPISVSVTSQVTTMAETKAEAAVCACIPGYASQAMEGAERLGWEPQWILSSVNLNKTCFGGPCEGPPEGTLAFGTNIPIDQTDDPAVQEHIRIMNKYGDVAPANFSIVGQIAGELTIEVLERACESGTLSRQTLMNAVESLRDYQSDLSLPGVTTTITDDDHIATEAMRPLRAKIVNGQGQWQYEGDLIFFR